MKNNTRNISLILSIIFVILLTPFSAVATTADEDIENDAIYQEIESLIETISFEKEFYGLSDIDLSCINIGAEIPAYNVINGKLIASDIRYIPILNDKLEIVSMVIIWLKNGEYLAQISTALVDEINSYRTNDLPIALIYDDDSVYLSTKDRNQLLHKNDNKVQGRTSISKVKAINTIKRSNINTVNIINANSNSNSNASLKTTYYYAYCNVPLISQPENYLCWASCVASIGNYITSSDFDPEDIAGDNDTSLNIGDAIDILNEVYDLDYYASTGNLTVTQIITLLRANKPIYTRIVCGPSAHAVVLRGIHAIDETFSVMDPELGSYATGVMFTAGGTLYYYYISAYSNFEYYFQRMGYDDNTI
jgi:hypothetical protein